MVLKIHANSKWYYYDKIRTLEKENVSCKRIKDNIYEIVNASGISNEPDYLIDTTKLGNDQDIKCRRVIYKTEDNTTGVIVLNSYAYLLNSEGKTMDKF